MNTKYRYSNDEQYYFVSFQRKGDAPAWIRMGYLTREETHDWIETCASYPTTYTNLQIYPESVLSMRVLIDEESSERKEISLREALFGSTYAADNEFWESIRNGSLDMDWKSGYQEWIRGSIMNSSVNS